MVTGVTPSEPAPEARRASTGGPPSSESLLDPPDSFPPSARRRLWLLGTDAGVWRLRALIAGLMVLAFLAYIAVGANRPADPTLAPTAPRVPPPGFGEIAFSIERPEGEPTTGCAVLADAEPQWAEGFMHKRAIPGYDAMVFRFREPRGGAFYNRNVPITLDIAWFDPAGGFVDATRMAPCEDIDSCPLYRPRADYLFAVETPVGGLTRLGADSPGTVLKLTGPCTAG